MHAGRCTVVLVVVLLSAAATARCYFHSLTTTLAGGVMISWSWLDWLTHVTIDMSVSEAQVSQSLSHSAAGMFAPRSYRTMR